MSLQKVVRNAPVDAPLPPLSDPGHAVRAPHGAKVGASWDEESVVPQAAAEVLRVTNLGKTFRSGFLRRKLRGISEVSFTVSQGSVFAILGHNGAGKTTTINCILDLVHADTGEVRIFGRRNNDQKARAGLGYLPERPYFFEHLTGRELLVFYADLLGIPRHRHEREIVSVLGRTGMTGTADRRLKKYSKGMLQRIGLAQALLGDPSLLILDEPMSGLDPVGRREVRNLLLELKAQGKTIILSSHIVPDVEMLADTVAVLCDGRLVKVQELSRLTDGSRYEIRIRPVVGGSAATVITAENAPALRQVLNQCASDGLEVLDITSRRSGLEDLFLKAVGHGEVRP